MTYVTQQEHQQRNLSVVESWGTQTLGMGDRQWLILKLVGLGFAILLVGGLALMLYPHLTRTAPVHYQTLIVPTVTRGETTLYGLREVLEADGWRVHWGHPDNTAFAWKDGEGLLIVEAGRTTAARQKVRRPELHFTPAIVLEGRHLYAPPAFFTALLGDSFRIEATSGLVQLRR